jgi:ribosomal protein S18 acetylase RimI-like enzyme
MQITIRRANLADLEHVKWALYTAVAWDPGRELPPMELTLQHPELERYHRDWGRDGDAGVVAEADGETLGAAFFRLFTDDDHGHGYVDPDTPELAVAVREDHRGRGLGTELLNQLADLARAQGFRRLSLSVDSGNPARGLYERLGYRELSADEGGVRMALEL